MGKQFQGIEPAQRHQAEAIDAADHGGIANTGFDPLPGIGENLAARCTGRRHRGTRSAQTEIAMDEAGERVEIVGQAELEGLG